MSPRHQIEFRASVRLTGGPGRSIACTGGCGIWTVRAGLGAAGNTIRAGVAARIPAAWIVAARTTVARAPGICSAAAATGAGFAGDARRGATLAPLAGLTTLAGARGVAAATASSPALPAAMLGGGGVSCHCRTSRREERGGKGCDK